MSNAGLFFFATFVRLIRDFGSGTDTVPAAFCLAVATSCAIHYAQALFEQVSVTVSVRLICTWIVIG